MKSLVGIVPGREVDTVHSSVSVTLKAGGHGGGGHGYLIFKYPDRFHIAMLSPFGLTVLDLFNDGQKLTCLVPSQQIAYQGSAAELPERGGLKAFGLLKWVVARTPPWSGPGGDREVTTAQGDRLSYDKNGLLSRKISPEGDEVTYKEYSNVNGVAFPGILEIRNSYGDTARIEFDEPEVNGPVDDSTLIPDLKGSAVLPLSQFKGM